jgi:hypothetical protein
MTIEDAIDFVDSSDCKGVFVVYTVVTTGYPEFVKISKSHALEILESYPKISSLKGHIQNRDLIIGSRSALRG